MDKNRPVQRIFNLKQGRRLYRIVDKAGEATVYLYEEIGYFGVMANEFVKDLDGIEASTINLRINSPGGDVFDGLAMYNALKNHSAKVIATIDGIALSAASFIAMAADEIVMERNAQMMIHDAMGVAIGLNATEMQDMVNLLEKNSDNIADIYAQKAGGTVESWREAMKAETWYSAEEAVAAGLADRVGGEGDSAGAQNTWDLAPFNRGSGEMVTYTIPTPKAPEEPAPEIDFSSLADIIRNSVKGAVQ